jgi:hypothetical protein
MSPATPLCRELLELVQDTCQHDQVKVKITAWLAQR